mgnify:CR=1 FL=1
MPIKTTSISDELAKKVKDQEGKLGEAGKGVVALNDLTAVYLSAMAKMTYPLQDSAAMAAGLAAALRSFIGEDSVATQTKSSDDPPENRWEEILEKEGIDILTGDMVYNKPSLSPMYENWLKNNKDATEERKREMAAEKANQMNHNNAIQSLDTSSIVEPNKQSVAEIETTVDEKILIAMTDKMKMQSANYSAALNNLNIAFKNNSAIAVKVFKLRLPTNPSIPSTML